MPVIALIAVFSSSLRDLEIEAASSTALAETTAIYMQMSCGKGE
jgi:hypothetical protein